MEPVSVNFDASLSIGSYIDSTDVFSERAWNILLFNKSIMHMDTEIFHYFVCVW